MHQQFWHERWDQNRIGFHEPVANPALVQHWGTLNLPAETRVLVPLCGKSLDLIWLLDQGHQVVGIELVESAVQQFFSEQKMEPQISAAGPFSHYQAGNLDLYTGDIFAMTPKILGPVAAIYDRAALVALPREMRTHYTRRLSELTKRAPQLLVSFEYDQTEMNGPPFSIPETEIHEHYAETYEIVLLSDTDVPGGLKNLDNAREKVWRLTPK